MIFTCPKCGEVLAEANETSAKCRNGHSYDRAKEGYYNLFLTSAGGVHGDSREMVEARRIFLNTGAYLPLAECVSRLAIKYYNGKKLLDIGCGEGYYTDIIAHALDECGKTSDISGFDISKDAVRRAARRNHTLSLAVASAYKMPFADGTFDMAFNMFSPLALSETVRVLRQNGIFIMAIPGEDHLFGLKNVAYDTPYKNEISDPLLTGFELLETKSVKYMLDLKQNSDIRALFMMTPYAYRTPPKSRDRVLSLSSLSTPVEFVVFIYRKL